MNYTENSHFYSEFMPKGPSESSKIRAYAEKCLEEITSSESIIKDKTSFFNFMSELNNKLLGISPPKPETKEKIIFKMPIQNNQNISKAKFTNDMKQASYNSLNKVKELRLSFNNDKTYRDDNNIYQDNNDIYRNDRKFEKNIESINDEFRSSHSNQDKSSNHIGLNNYNQDRQSDYHENYHNDNRIMKNHNDSRHLSNQYGKDEYIETYRYDDMDDNKLYHRSVKTMKPSETVKSEDLNNVKTIDKNKINSNKRYVDRVVDKDIRNMNEFDDINATNNTNFSDNNNMNKINGRKYRNNENILDNEQVYRDKSDSFDSFHSLIDNLSAQNSRISKELNNIKSQPTTVNMNKKQPLQTSSRDVSNSNYRKDFSKIDEAIDSDRNYDNDIPDSVYNSNEIGSINHSSEGINSKKIRKELNPNIKLSDSIDDENSIDKLTSLESSMNNDAINHVSSLDKHDNKQDIKSGMHLDSSSYYNNVSKNYRNDEFIDRSQENNEEFKVLPKSNDINSGTTNKSSYTDDLGNQLSSNSFEFESDSSNKLSDINNLNSQVDGNMKNNLGNVQPSERNDHSSNNKNHLPDGSSNKLPDVNNLSSQVDGNMKNNLDNVQRSEKNNYNSNNKNRLTGRYEKLDTTNEININNQTGKSVRNIESIDSHENSKINNRVQDIKFMKLDKDSNNEVYLRTKENITINISPKLEESNIPTYSKKESDNLKENFIENINLNTNKIINENKSQKLYYQKSNQYEKLTKDINENQFNNNNNSIKYIDNDNIKERKDIKKMSTLDLSDMTLTKMKDLLGHY